MGLSLFTLMFARIGTKAIQQAELHFTHSAPSNPFAYLPFFDKALLYGAVALGVALLVWPDRKE
jgi:hypothetical protein